MAAVDIITSSPLPLNGTADSNSPSLHQALMDEVRSRGDRGQAPLTEDPEFIREMMRPAEIKEDVKFMQQRGRVNLVLNSQLFRDELEQIWEDMLRKNQADGLSALEQLTDMLRLPATNVFTKSSLSAAAPLLPVPSLATSVGGSLVTPINDLRGPGANATESCGRVERILRCKLAAFARLIDLHGWAHGTHALLTARVQSEQVHSRARHASKQAHTPNSAEVATPPATPNHNGLDESTSSKISTDADDVLLANPLGLHLHEVSAASLQKLVYRALSNENGNAKLSREDMLEALAVGQPALLSRGTTLLPVNALQLRLHAALLALQSDLQAVVFLNSPAIVAVSSQKGGLLPLSQEAMIVGAHSNPEQNKIGYYSAEQGLPQTSAQLAQFASTIEGGKRILFIPNWGALVCGASVEECAFYSYFFDMACQTQMLFAMCPLENLTIPQQWAQSTAEEIGTQGASHVDLISSMGTATQLAKQLLSSVGLQPTDSSHKEVAQKWKIGELEFEAFMRHLDNAGYRTGYPYKQPVIRAPLTPRGEVQLPSLVEYFDLEVPSKPTSKPMPHMLTVTRKSDRRLGERSISARATLERGLSAEAAIAIGAAMGGSGAPSPAKTPIREPVPKKELKEGYKKVKENYYKDTKTSGPQSQILDGVTWDEAAAMRAAGEKNAPQISAASKAVIQREYQPAAYIYNRYKQQNPFEAVTDAELADYKAEVERKLRGEPEPVPETQPAMGPPTPEPVSPVTPVTPITPVQPTVPPVPAPAQLPPAEPKPSPPASQPQAQQPTLRPALVRAVSAQTQAKRTSREPVSGVTTSVAPGQLALQSQLVGELSGTLSIPAGEVPSSGTLPKQEPQPHFPPEYENIKVEKRTAPMVSSQPVTASAPVRASADVGVLNGERGAQITGPRPISGPAQVQRAESEKRLQGRQVLSTIDVDLSERERKAKTIDRSYSERYPQAAKASGTAAVQVGIAGTATLPGQISPSEVTEEKEKKKKKGLFSFSRKKEKK